jgi:hypothetical protein
MFIPWSNSNEKKNLSKGNSSNIDKAVIIKEISMTELSNTL